ncbi:alpha/beta hydrolase [Pseudoruegeria sp. SHC-113]|uniref:alpha/beta hydrolase n=1 Tax=Pseudoruegeria sp. SHC-113 TaxID=2855439 RepID=UPI0021BB1399|nr:alpha/beta-hydrolase family protein [Pseudoruegeria sp. SHC-113]MCT8160298.1 alpha/beta-hydrolase family protein [Pseudoruegeria sp. SHC-113]
MPSSRRADFPPPRYRFHPLPLLLATACFCAALTPSMVPRDAMLLGLLAGLVAGIGYEIGNQIRRLWNGFELPHLPATPARLLRRGAYGISLAAIVYCLFRAADWQNATRAVMSLAPVDETHPLTVATYGAVAFLGLWLLCRLLGTAFDVVERLLRPIVPARVGVVLALIAVGWLAWSLASGVLITRAFQAADATFEAADLLIEPAFPRPDDPQKTGSDASLLRWEELGRRGREFVASAPSPQEISAFSGSPAVAPLRVYVGRRAAETPQERADIALQELIRQGGFERGTLVVMVPTGTGWMDPGSHDALDFMLGGDVATVSVQYSYLSSVLSLLSNADYGLDQAEALFHTIYEHWTQLPKESRPRLYVHGLSQGAFNSQSTLPILDLLADPIDGALWVGSPFLSPFWQYVRNERVAESPAWRPTLGNSSLVRVMTQNGAMNEIDAPWGPMRLVFLHYGSDPIVFFSFRTAFERPDWMEAPRAPDVAPEFRWYPLVTLFQLALDMGISLDVEGYGHLYIARDYVDGWAEVLAPEGWTAGRSEALKATLAARGSAY